MKQGISAIVTGAASGIGAAVALSLAKPGACLTLHTRRAIHNLNGIAERARSLGAEVETILGDLADSGIGRKIVDTHRNRFDCLDALVANAGFPLLVSLEMMTPDDIAYAFQGNSQSFFELSQASHSLLCGSECPRIVGVGSFTAHLFRSDMPQYPASAASKGAVEVAVRSLSIAFAKDGITVNCVVPGYIRRDAGPTDGMDAAALQDIENRIPLRRFGTPDDVSNCICFLLSPGASYLTGQSIHVNGGLI